MLIKIIPIGMRPTYFLFIILTVLQSCIKDVQPQQDSWYRPSENPVFTSAQGNNHDAILFAENSQEYPYYLIISSWGCDTGNSEKSYLYRTKNFHWSSEQWELIDSNYHIGCQYEYDDAVKVNDTYYIYEDGLVYTYKGDLVNSSGKWKVSGTFPKHLCDDVGVFFEDGVFHLFGEYGKFMNKPDGTSLSHLSSKTGLGEWKVENLQAVLPPEEQIGYWGVGDPTIIKIDSTYYIYCDKETLNSPYQIAAFSSSNLYANFKFTGTTLKARSNEMAHWDNYRIQDPDIAFIPSLNVYVMVCNFYDKDGIPGGKFPKLNGATRVIGMYYSETGTP